MSFGRRSDDDRSPRQAGSRPQAGGRAAPPSAIRSQLQPRDDESESSSWGSVALFGIAFAAVAALGMIWFAMPARQPHTETAGTEESQELRLENPFETARRRMEMTSDQLALERPYDIVMAFPVKNISPALAQRNESLRDGCFEQMNSKQPYRGMGTYPDRAVDPAKSVLKFDYEVAGEAFDCLFNTERQRFCEAGERAKIVSAVSTYLKRYRQEVASANYVPTNAQGRMFKGLADRMKAMDHPASDDDDVASNKDSPSIDQRLISGLESLSQDGYFTAADFSGSAFTEISSHILKPVSKPCG
jgi:hypothetical protein